MGIPKVRELFRSQVHWKPNLRTMRSLKLLSGTLDGRQDDKVLTLRTEIMRNLSKITSMMFSSQRQPRLSIEHIERLAKAMAKLHVQWDIDPEEGNKFDVHELFHFFFEVADVVMDSSQRPAPPSTPRGSRARRQAMQQTTVTKEPEYGTAFDTYQSGLNYLVANGTRLPSLAEATDNFWSAFLKSGHESQISHLLLVQTMCETACPETDCRSRYIQTCSIGPSIKLQVPLRRANTGTRSMTLEKLLSNYARSRLGAAEACPNVTSVNSIRPHRQRQFVYRKIVRTGSALVFEFFHATECHATVILPERLDLSDSQQPLPSEYLPQRSPQFEKIPRIWTLTAVLAHKCSEDRFVTYVKDVSTGGTLKWAMHASTDKVPQWQSPSSVRPQFAVYLPRGAQLPWPAPSLEPPKLERTLATPPSSAASYASRGATSVSSDAMSVRSDTRVSNTKSLPSRTGSSKGSPVSMRIVRERPGILGDAFRPATPKAGTLPRGSPRPNIMHPGALPPSTPPPLQGQTKSGARSVGTTPSSAPPRKVADRGESQTRNVYQQHRTSSRDPLSPTRHRRPQRPLPTETVNALEDLSDILVLQQEATERELNELRDCMNLTQQHLSASWQQLLTLRETSQSRTEEVQRVVISVLHELRASGMGHVVPEEE